MWGYPFIQPTALTDGVVNAYMHTLSRKSMGKQVIRAVVYREKGMIYAIENGFCEEVGLIGEHGRDSLQTSGIEQVRV